MAKKWSAWLTTGLVLAGQISAFGAATGIDLLSQDHHVWGSAGSATQYYPGGTEVSYDQTSSDPLDVLVNGTYLDLSLGEMGLTAWSKAGDFRVETQGAYWFSEAYAQSEYVLAPQVEVSALSFQLSGSGYGVGLSNETNIRFALDDLTTGTSLVSLVAPGDAVPGPSDWDSSARVWSMAWDGRYPVDPTHTYGLTLSAYAGDGDGTRGALLDLDVWPLVPAPGALLLTVIGAALVGWRRRSIARQPAMTSRIWTGSDLRRTPCCGEPMVISGPP